MEAAKKGRFHGSHFLSIRMRNALALSSDAHRRSTICELERHRSQLVDRSKSLPDTALCDTSRTRAVLRVGLDDSPQLAQRHLKSVRQLLRDGNADLDFSQLY